MSEPRTIDLETVPAGQTQALAVREQGGAVARAMTIDELRANLDYIKQVMQSVMKEGQDYGKIPGCGDKPCLMQPGAQKLLMTFQLTDHVKKEVLREYPNWHREYEFTVCVRAQNGKEWDGVGTCSTLESKYRYRKAERRCPACGKNTIIQGKAEFGGGWLCWKKKGGCGAKFAESEPKITAQPANDVENEDPADSWNTVRKMAFKRALVAAAINATNTSELWTQDLDEKAPEAPGRAASPPPSQRSTQAPKPAPAPQRQAAPATNAPLVTPPTPTAAPAPTVAPKFATDQTRLWMIENLKAGIGEENRRIAQEYWVKVGQILENESPEELPLRFVPINRAQLAALVNCVGNFESGGDAIAAFPANPEAPPAKPLPKPKAAEKPKPVEVPRDPPGPAGDPHAADKWFMGVIVPVPRRGQKRDEYLKHPDTIGSLFEQRHGNDEEAQAARQRLWGFCNNYEAKGWEKRDGTKMPPSAADIKFQEALDAFNEWFEREHPDEKL